MNKIAIIVFMATISIHSLSIGSEEPGFNQHTGFFLSMSIGPTFGKINDEMTDGFQTQDLEISGFSMTFDFKIGGAPVENLIVSADLISRAMVEPKLEVDGQSLGNANDVTVGDQLYGVGLTYYIMPQNMFISGTVGASQFTIDNDDLNIRTETEFGPGLQVKVGKEFWVSKNWGLGVSGSYGFSSGTDEEDGVDETVTSHKFSVMFNTTFN